MYIEQLKRELVEIRKYKVLSEDKMPITPVRIPGLTVQTAKNATSPNLASNNTSPTSLDGMLSGSYVFMGWINV